MRSLFSSHAWRAIQRDGMLARERLRDRVLLRD
jgi:hypothetical protein